MRAARIVIPAMALLGAGSLGVTLFRIRRGAEEMSAQLGTRIEIEPLTGVWVITLSLALTLVGGLLFGRLPARGESYPDDPDAHGPTEIVHGD